MRNTLLALLVLLSLPAGAPARAADALPFLAALRTAQPPALDGRLDEPCWQGAEQTPPFVCIGGAAAPVETRGRACWDDTHLYVAVTCGEPLMGVLRERRDKGLLTPMEESVEIFIDTECDRFTYLQLRVGAQGERDTHNRNDIAHDLTPRWRAAAAGHEDHWSIEAAIPFALLGGRPAPDALWGINFCRQRCIRPEGMWTCWSDTRGGFHSPDRFGRLVFAPYGEWLGAYFGRRADGLAREMAEMAGAYPQGAAGMRERLPALEARRAEFRGAAAAAAPAGGPQCLAFFERGEALLASYERALDELRLAVIASEFR